jgi:FixJ family two-component response regulator
VVGDSATCTSINQKMSRKGGSWRNVLKSGNVILRKGQMISIVDDDESVRESTKALVRSLGYGARAFGSAEEFLSSDPDDTSCLILDVQMKGLSGVELQDRLKAEGRRIPIIFITAFADDGMRSHVLESGAIGFLRKPFSDEKLINCIDSALAQYDC